MSRLSPVAFVVETWSSGGDARWLDAAVTAEETDDGCVVLIDVERISASYHSGVLEIRLPTMAVADDTHRSDID